MTSPPVPILHTLIADDGVELAYATWEPSEGAPPPTDTATTTTSPTSSPTTPPSVLLLHGWSGSRRYWDPAIPVLTAAGCRVIAPDLRWHGDSGRPPAGHTVARLGDDLACLLAALARPPASVTGVGSSMGAAILWAHARDHAASGLARHVYVDQAPLQDRVPGWTLGSKGCYDAATLAGLQAAVRGDGAAFAAGNAAACLAQPIPAALAALLAAETGRADADGLARLMADHTANDWRPVLHQAAVLGEALVVIGGRSDIFPPAGCAAVADAMGPARAAAVTFTAGGHWLYLEQPAEFGALVAAFAAGGLAGVAGWGDVGPAGGGGGGGGGGV